MALASFMLSETLFWEYRLPLVSRMVTSEMSIPSMLWLTKSRMDSTMPLLSLSLPTWVTVTAAVAGVPWGSST